MWTAETLVKCGYHALLLLVGFSVAGVLRSHAKYPGLSFVAGGRSLQRSDSGERDLPGALVIPHVPPNYHLVRVIGKGGMGTVYEAFHPILKRRFAVKVLLAAAAQNPDARARFLREAEAAGRIVHPNVVQVTDVGVGGETPYLVMEYLEGQTLAAFFAERGRLDVQLALDLLLPVFAGVAAGHAMGVIHRDLKPENIFLARDAGGELTPKVLDFGVSKLLDDGASALLTAPQMVLGTAAYMSPEQARGARDVDCASDQYALGLLLYEALAGTRAHPGQSSLEVLHNIANLPVVRLRHLRPDCPQSLEDVVMRMLSRAPEYRFPSLLAAGAALLAHASPRTAHLLTNAFVAEGAAPRPAQVAARAVSTPRRSDATTMAATGWPRSRRRIVLAVAALPLVLSLGVAAWRSSARSRPPLPAVPPVQRETPPPPPPEPLPATPNASEPAAPEPPPRRSGHAVVSRSRRTAKARQEVRDPARTTSPEPRRGVNDALILE